MGRVRRYAALVRAERCSALFVFIGMFGVGALPLSGQVADRIQAFENTLGPAVAVAEEARERWTLQERMAHWNVPGLSIAVIRDGKLSWARAYGVRQVSHPEPIDTETVFSVGSVSKVGNAATILRMVDAGELELDRNVNAYLTRWQVPANEFTAARPVTLRGILSHTAGLTLHGFPDFRPGEELPTIEETLDGLGPAHRTEPVRVDIPPGTRFRYSGGGTTVAQLVVEEATGLSYAEATQRYLFQPLGMARSTYENPLPEAHGNIAKAHNAQGEPVALPRGYEAMPEQAASGLWTTPSDYAKLVIALIESYQGGKATFLSTALAREMMTEVGPSSYGLGPNLAGEGIERRFSHGGANDSYRAYIEGRLLTGDGVVILTNGTQGWSLIPEVRRAIAIAEGWRDSGVDELTANPVWEIPASLRVVPAELAEFVGTYRVDDPQKIVARRANANQLTGIRVWLEGDELTMGPGEDGGWRPVPLQQIAAGQFLDANGRRIEFVRDYKGTITHLIVWSGRYSVEAVRMESSG